MTYKDAGMAMAIVLIALCYAIYHYGGCLQYALSDLRHLAPPQCTLYHYAE